MSEQAPVLIAGGGIGGLAAAMGLARQGVPSLVLEKARRFGEIGAGIQLGSNAFHAFDHLGVGDAARAMAVHVDSLRMMDAMTGEEIVRIPTGEAFRARFRNPYAVVHRGDLHGVFLAACQASPLVALRTASEVTDTEQDGAGVTAILASGERVRGRALIGADGLWSNIRKRVVGDGAPRVSGHTTFRSVIPVDRMPEDLRWNAATLWAGPKVHLVHYPLSGWTLFNRVVTCHNDAPEPVAGKPVTHDEVRAHFTHIAPMARQIIGLGTEWKLRVLCDRDPVTGRAVRRVALMGDAAHPMLQYMAQGACMAMAGAVCLSAEVGRAGGDGAATLPACNAARVLRTARVRSGPAAGSARVCHPAGAHAALRNPIMRAKTADDCSDARERLQGATGLVSGGLYRDRFPCDQSHACHARGAP